MKELLEGRRVGFALRPPLAAVAVGLGIALTLLDLMGWGAWSARDTNGFVVAAYWLAIAALIVTLLAFVTALAELRDVPFEDRGLARLDALGTIVAALLYAGSAAFRAFDLGAAAASPAALLLAAAGLLLLLAGAAMALLLYAAREWEEIEEITRERHGRRRAASR